MIMIIMIIMYVVVIIMITKNSNIYNNNFSNRDDNNDNDYQQCEWQNQIRIKYSLMEKFQIVTISSSEALKALRFLR